MKPTNKFYQEATVIMLFAEHAYEQGWSEIVECYDIPAIAEEIAIDQLLFDLTDTEAVEHFIEGVKLRHEAAQEVRAIA